LTLVKSGKITREQALTHAIRPDELTRLLDR